MNLAASYPLQAFVIESICIGHSRCQCQYGLAIMACSCELGLYIHTRCTYTSYLKIIPQLWKSYCHFNEFHLHPDLPCSIKKHWHFVWWRGLSLSSGFLQNQGNLPNIEFPSPNSEWINFLEFIAIIMRGSSPNNHLTSRTRIELIHHSPSNREGTINIISKHSSHNFNQCPPNSITDLPQSPNIGCNETESSSRLT
jgi:hypothetical protein